jgi:hypothetical protein
LAQTIRNVQQQQQQQAVAQLGCLASWMSNNNTPLTEILNFTSNHSYVLNFLTDLAVK